MLAVTFCLSAFFSGSETALFSLPPEEVKKMASSSGVGSAIAALLSRPRHLLSTILLGNMVVNVLFYSVSFLLILEYRQVLGGTGSVLAGVGALLCVIVFCEVTPKNLAVVFNRPWSRFAALPLLALQKVLWPLILPLERLTGALTALLARGAPVEPLIKSEELQMLIEHSEREGILDLDLSQMIGSVMELSGVSARQVMVPRVEMIAFEMNDPPQELMRLFCTQKVTRIPVYEGSIDNVLGVIHVRDLFFKGRDTPLRDLLRRVPFLPETASLEDVLRQFRQQKATMALVVDEYGAIVGLVTIEGMLEEIVGEIADEYDVEELPPVERLDERRFRVRGDLKAREWQELFSMELPELSVDTMGGLVMALLGRIPHEGDRAGHGNLQFVVERASGRRVVSVIVELTGPALPGHAAR